LPRDLHIRVDRVTILEVRCDGRDVLR
jgi:hypothetical protein